LCSEEDLQRYACLRGKSTSMVRLRFALLWRLNHLAALMLPLVNLEWVGRPNSLGAMVSRGRHLLFRPVKTDYVQRVLDQTATASDSEKPSVVLDRIGMAARREAGDADLYRTTNFGMAFSQLKGVHPKRLRHRRPMGAEPFFSLELQYRGENVQGFSGPYRQFYTDISAELRTGSIPLFMPTPNAQSGIGSHRDHLIPVPAHTSPTHLALYELLGLLVGTGIRTGVYLGLSLPATFWKRVVGEVVSMTDFNAVDEVCGKALQFVMDCDDEGLFEDSLADETFTTRLSDGSLVDLMDGGSRVPLTYEQREVYCKLVQEARLREGERQISAFQRGLTSVIPQSVLRLCTWEDLSTWACGKEDVDVELLRRNTVVSGVAPGEDEPMHVQNFWTVLHEFTAEERRRFLHFAWAQERLPQGDDEFERTRTRMFIKPASNSSGDPDKRLPKADTCFFNIELPSYSSVDVMRERLLFAMNTDADSMNADNPDVDDIGGEGHEEDDEY